ncbi:MAG: carbohydrate kinase [Bacteroidota bacterium]|nr:carbohydrate kinase [Bacteroidota bacterium]
MKAQSLHSGQNDSPNIYAIGESLIDIIFRDDDTVTAKPGGSMLNACISLGRLGHHVHFLTEFGNDKAGDRIAAFLDVNQVTSEFSIRHEGHKTTLALAWLDKSGNASYSFYQDMPETAPEIRLPDFKPGDILLFGSHYSIRKRNRSNIGKLLNTARDAGAIILYDPNVRPSKFRDTPDSREQIFNMIDKSDIVKGSDEDFAFLYHDNRQSGILSLSERQDQLFFLTSGRNGVEVVFRGKSTHHDIPEIVPVSTIGAGDNFNVGIIDAIISGKYTKPWNPESLHAMARKGIELSKEVCLRTENYIARR